MRLQLDVLLKVRLVLLGPCSSGPGVRDGVICVHGSLFLTLTRKSLLLFLLLHREYSYLTNLCALVGFSQDKYAFLRNRFQSDVPNLLRFHFFHLFQAALLKTGT